MPKVFMIVLMCVAVGLLMTVRAFVQHHRLEAVAVQSVSGTLVTYDASRHDLIIHTSDGDRHVTVPEDTSVHEGARVRVHADLATASGCLAKVWYRDTGLTWIASDVRVWCRRLVAPGDSNAF
jgi:hypothetical protein